MAKLKAPKSDACFDPESEPKKGNEKENKIIDVDRSATVTTTKLHGEDLEDPEEGECLFHSHMWVKGSLLQFLVDSGSQKNLIST